MPKKKQDKVVENLKNLIAIREGKNSDYGEAHKKKGEVIVALFGGIPQFDSAEDLSRYGMLEFIASKMVCYCANFHNGGHADSLDDIAVYTQMLKELDVEL